MSSELESYLHNRLFQWAQWTRSANRVNIGYPQQSTIFSMMLTGGVFIQNSGYVGTIGTLREDEAEEVEAWLKSLNDVSHELYQAITEYYLADTTPAAAKKLGLCVRVLQNRVKEAKSFLLGALIERNRSQLRVAA